MQSIKFGTDGWRAIIADDYTIENLKRVTLATANWLKEHYENPTVVIGNDCRFGGELFTETATKVLCETGIKVKVAKGFVSTPMVSLGIVKEQANLGIVITASHNPAAYNGFKLKGDFGGPALVKVIEEVEALIPDTTDLYLESIDELVAQKMIEYVDLEEIYFQHTVENFDVQKITDSDVSVAYDAMYGAGQDIVKRILPESIIPLHCEFNPSFNGQAPEPLDKNLQELSKLINQSTEIGFGFATDGDADRIGAYDADGIFIDSHHLILLLVHYLHKVKEMTGKVVISFSCSDKIRKLCELYGLQYEVTKIGFKYICEHMVNEDVLVGGEESGGIAVKGHIPERDGVWNGLLLLEFMAETGKSIKELIQEIYDLVGAFHFERDDLHLEEDLKQAIISNCKNNVYNTFGDFTITAKENIDGFKYYVGKEKWVMIRPSGTEPVLRIYCEASDKAEVRAILDATKSTLLNSVQTAV